MKAPKSKKRIVVSWHGHEWPVYPLKSRSTTVFRVFHRVNGERVPKTFGSLAKAKVDAKNLLKDLFDRPDNKIHLTDVEKLDWHAAMNLLNKAGLRCSLETAMRHYGDLVSIVGHASLLTDVAREYAECRGKTGTPIKLAALRDDYVEALRCAEVRSGAWPIWSERLANSRQLGTPIPLRSYGLPRCRASSKN
jgi:hypothetical protein